MLVLAGTVSVASAQGLSPSTQPVLATARLASQGIGYSVVYHQAGAPQLSYRVKVVCTVGQLSATAQCPSPRHEAHCPAAVIVCR